MELTCYIVDDESHAIKILSKYVEKTPGLKVIGWHTNPLEAWNAIDKKKVLPDIVFLDMDMPQLSGIQLAELINPIQTIFTTAHPDYAFQAFEKNAIDYLLKPINYERFLRAISKAKEILSRSHQEIPPGKEEDFYIKTETKGKMMKLKYHDIFYVEAKANYLKFYLDNKSHLAYLTMKELEEKLPSKRFARIHKSYIVNMEKILALEAYQILLENNKVIEIGRSYKNKLLEIINPKLISSKRIH